MKKILILTLIVTLTLALAACGGGDNEATASTTSADNGTTTPPSDTPAQTENADNLQSENTTNSGGDTTYEWPDNKWTQYMPKPDGELSDEPTEDVPGSTSSTCWFTVFGNRDDAKAYVEQLKAYGYTEDPEPTVIIEETETEYRWDGISPAIDEVYHYYITVHHFISEYGQTTNYDIIISNFK